MSAPGWRYIESEGGWWLCILMAWPLTLCPASLHHRHQLPPPGAQPRNSHIDTVLRHLLVPFRKRFPTNALRIYKHTIRGSVWTSCLHQNFWWLSVLLKTFLNAIAERFKILYCIYIKLFVWLRIHVSPNRPCLNIVEYRCQYWRSLILRVLSEPGLGTAVKVNPPPQVTACTYLCCAHLTKYRHATYFVY